MEEYEILRERHLRLRRIAEDLIENARPGSAPEDATVDAGLLVRREVAGEPQPSAFATMSIS